MYMRRGHRRMKNWDYRSSGYYFITIRTKGDWWFGHVVNGAMNLSDDGKIAQRYWNDIPNHFPNVILDSVIIMPDHLHGIVRLHFDDIDPNFPKIFHEFKQTVPRSLSTIIRSYKSSVTKTIHGLGNDAFRWQRNFHERMIRSDDALNRARLYIRNNPKKWIDSEVITGM